jgi:probable F420-dependent oxidoreductase
MASSSPIKVGILPRFQVETITSSSWVLEFLAAIEGCEMFESVWTIEHPIIAENYEPLYPYSESGLMPTNASTVMPDPLEWLAFAAAVTQRLFLGTSVVIAPLHNATVLAKRVSTLDALSNGRMLLGVGMGWQREEYDAVGIPYDERGPRLDETIEAMQHLWADEVATYRGRFIHFESVRCEARPVQRPGIPIVVGGSTPAAARRAGRLGDGFYPHAVSPDQFSTLVETMRAAALDAGRDPDKIELTIRPASWDADGLLDRALNAEFVARGAQRLVISADAAPSHDIEAVMRLADEFRDQVLAHLP